MTIDELVAKLPEWLDEAKFRKQSIFVIFEPRDHTFMAAKSLQGLRKDIKPILIISTDGEIRPA